MPQLENDKHERFASFIAIGTPLTSAYMDSGFEPATRDVACVSACRLMRREDIQARIAEIKVEVGTALKDNNISREWLAQVLERNVRIAFGMEPFATVMEAKRKSDGTVEKDDDGEVVMVPVNKFRYEPAAANKSLELLGQLMGEFKKFDGTLRGDPNNPVVTRLDVTFVGLPGAGDDDHG